jgi:hypothetical protein
MMVYIYENAGSRVPLQGRTVKMAGIIAVDTSLDLSSVLDERHARISSGKYQQGMELLTPLRPRNMAHCAYE